MTSLRQRALAHLPGLRRLLAYERGWLRSDLLGGLTVGAMLIPQCMAYAELGGFRPKPVSTRCFGRFRRTRSSGAGERGPREQSRRRVLGGLRLRRRGSIDTTAMDMLRELSEALPSGTLETIALARANRTTRDVLGRAGLIEPDGPLRTFATINAAVRAFERSRAALADGAAVSVAEPPREAFASEHTDATMSVRVARARSPRRLDTLSGMSRRPHRIRGGARVR